MRQGLGKMMQGQQNRSLIEQSAILDVFPGLFRQHLPDHGKRRGVVIAVVAGDPRFLHEQFGQTQARLQVFRIGPDTFCTRDSYMVSILAISSSGPIRLGRFFQFGNVGQARAGIMVQLKAQATNNWE